jgi:hypothetical protein
MAHNLLFILNLDRFAKQSWLDSVNTEHIEYSFFRKPVQPKYKNLTDQ